MRHIEGMTDPLPPQRRRLGPPAALLAVLAVLVGGGAWYGLSRSSAAGAAECRASAAVTERLKPLARGEVAALVVGTPKLPPEVAFTGPQGQAMTWADFKGR